MTVEDRYFKIAKPESTLLLDLPWSDRVLAALAGSRPGPLLPADGEEGRYIVDHGTGPGYWAPMMTGAPTLWQALPEEEVPAAYIEVVEATAAQLFQLHVVHDDEPLAFRRYEEELIDRSWIQLLSGAGALASVCPQARHALAQVMRASQAEGIVSDSVAHGNLHPGNVLVHDGEPRVIDLENLRPAPAFTDVVYGAIWARHVPEAWWSAVRALSDVTGREIEGRDVTGALAIMLMQANETTESAAADLADAVHWIAHSVIERLLAYDGGDRISSCGWSR